MRLADREKRNYQERDVVISINAEIIKSYIRGVVKTTTLNFSCDNDGRLYSILESCPNLVSIDLFTNIFGLVRSRIAVKLPSYDAKSERAIRIIIEESLSLALKD